VFPMLDLATPLPCRRPELVARPFGDNGAYLVRNRRAGESFQLGAAEHFLLARLDGTRTAGDLCTAFAERFGERLTEEDLQDFLAAARERGFLQPDGTPTPLAANTFEEDLTPPHPGQGPANSALQRSARQRRLAARLLSATATALQWP